MKRLTSILHVNIASSAIAAVNDTGLALAQDIDQYFELQPIQNLSKTVAKLNGRITNSNMGIGLWLPLVFENNTVICLGLAQLPSLLRFFLVLKKVENQYFDGLVIQQNRYFLSPRNNTINYTYDGKTIACTPCGKADKISKADLLPILNYPLDKLSVEKDMGINVGTNTRVIDLKMIVNGKEFILTNERDFKIVNEQMSTMPLSKITVVARTHSTNALLKNTTEYLMINQSMPTNAIGIIEIPKSSLKIAELDASKYSMLNHFVAHFDQLKIRLDLELSLSAFEQGAKLFIDNQELTSLNITNSAEYAGFKLIKKTVNDYGIFAGKINKIEYRRSNKVVDLPFKPMAVYQPTTKTSIIKIRKQI